MANAALPSGIDNKILIGAIAAAAACFISVYLGSRYYLTHITADVKRYLDTVKKIERGYVEYIPLYIDHATPFMELKLRTYLFPAHMEAARKSGMASMESGDAIPDYVSNGKLINLKSGPDALYYFYNVSTKYRVLSPAAACGLSILTKRFQKNIAARAALPQVKIALSSVLRPTSYQTGLRGKNYNATMMTTHSYGVSFDIFYDDYYVALPAPVCSNRISKAVLDQVRTRMGFLLGDALREQFRSVLMDTLIQLQDEGVIYAILEKQQRCYHVTVLPDPKCGAKDPL
jgi:hypothetical protein